MKLQAAIAAYLTAQRASGRLYETTEALLRSFARRAGDIPLERITPGTVRAFCGGPGPPTRLPSEQMERPEVLSRVPRGLRASERDPARRTAAERPLHLRAANLFPRGTPGPARVHADS